MQRLEFRKIVESNHERFYDPIKNKAAKGYQDAALEEMHALYEGKPELVRIAACLSDRRKVANFISAHMPGGSKGKYLSHHTSFLSLLVSCVAPSFSTTPTDPVLT